MNPVITRRQAVKLISGSGLALYLAPRIDWLGGSSDAWAAADSKLAEISPINRSLGEIAPKIWFSDYPDTAHKILWDKAAYLASLGAKAPSPKEEVPLVVIGGGMSGLLTAYLLRQHKPVVLEQAPRFGGNSKGQSWHGIDYSIGAAYFIEPEEDSDIAKLVTELGIDKIWKIKKEEDPVALNGKIFTGFWTGESASDEATKAQIKKLDEYFRTVNEGEEITYPDIPITDPEIEGYIKELDRETFKAHLERIAEGPLTPQVETVIEHYCWSSFGASSSEISAACGLNFYASEFGNVVVLPGGNSAMAERVLERLSTAMPLSNLRSDCLVYDVKATDTGVIVSYRDGNGNPQALKAKVAVMACPKFVVGRVLSDIEPERLAAIRKLRYHSYLVANVCIKGGGKPPFYDLYMLGEGKTKSTDPLGESNRIKVTDVIYADYAKPVNGNTVLTLYRGLPYDGARAEVLAPTSYQRYFSEFEKQLKESILPLLKIKEENVADIRIARWGHPLPVAAPGLIADGVVDVLRKPFKDKVFFVEQDNWALPAFETAVTEAQIWAPEIENAINPKPKEVEAETQAEVQAPAAEEAAPAQ